MALRRLTDGDRVFSRRIPLSFILSVDFWQVLANVVTAFGLPLAIFTFMLEQRKQRENKDEEVYPLLYDA